MTKNLIFEWVMRTVQLSFGSYDFVLYEDDYYREKTLLNWIETAKGIAARKPLKALSFIGYHYVLLARCIKEKNKDTDKNSSQNPGSKLGGDTRPDGLIDDQAE